MLFNYYLLSRIALKSHVSLTDDYCYKGHPGPESCRWAVCIRSTGSGESCPVMSPRHERWIFVFWLLKAVETFQIEQKDRNGHTGIQVMKQHMAYCA